MLLVSITISPNCWKNSTSSENIFKIQLNIFIYLCLHFYLCVCWRAQILAIVSVHVKFRATVEAHSLLPSKEPCDGLRSSGLVALCLCWLSYLTSSGHYLSVYFLGGSEDGTLGLMCAEQVFSLGFPISTSEDTLTQNNPRKKYTTTKLTLKNAKGLQVGERLLKWKLGRCRK